MQDIDRHGGIAFLIVYFHLYDKYMLVPFELLHKFYTNYQNGGRASIPFDVISPEFEIKLLNSSVILYLDAINTYIELIKNKNYTG